jgi:hypothetical protein
LPVPNAVPNPNVLPDPTSILATLRTRDPRDPRDPRETFSFSRTALALSTETDMAPLLERLLRCRTMDERKLLALTPGLRVAAEGRQALLERGDGTVAP